MSRSEGWTELDGEELMPDEYWVSIGPTEADDGTMDDMVMVRARGRKNDEEGSPADVVMIMTIDSAANLAQALLEGVLVSHVSGRRN